MSKTRILVVDDEADFTIVLKLTLEQSGEFVVREENDAKQVVAAAGEFIPHLILMDVMMPGLSGYQVALLLNAEPQLKGIPIIFLTAGILKEEIESHDGVIRGRRFLAKPVEPVELFRAIQLAMALP